MIENQTKQLKLNVTNINSFLIKKNSEARSLRLQKRSFLFTQQKQEDAKKKEKKIESSGIKTTLNKITSSILSGPMSLFDKIMNFAGTILLGILINNLPAIIEKVQKFFSDNPWIINGIKFLFNVLGEGIKSVINLVNGFSTFVGATQQQIIIQRDNITREIANLDVMVGSMDVSLLDFMKDLGKKPTNQAPRPTPRQTPRQTPFQRTGGYGRYSAPSQQIPTTSSPTAPSPAPVPVPPAAPAPKPKGYARGGEVTRGVTRRSQAQPAQQERVSAPKIKSQTFTQGETGRAKAARQSINYFEVFKKTIDNFDIISKIDEENNKKFEELAINIKSMPSLFDDEDKKTSSPGGSPKDGGEAIEVNENEVIGTVGDTGLSSGAHLHIEDNSTPGGAIPRSLIDNIYVAGKPVSSGTMTSGIGERLHPVYRTKKMHNGEDWDQGWKGKKITLRGGLKFVNFIPEGSNPRYAGYGNVVVIQNTDGKNYFLGHLGSGPTNLQALQDKQKNQASARIPDTGVLSGNQSQIESQMFDYLKRNYGEKVAYGMLSNAMRESGYRTNTPDNPRFQGMFQWDRKDRWNRLSTWAKSQGLDPMDRGVQVRFAIKESMELGTLGRMQSAKTNEEAASIFYNEFERAAYSRPIKGRNYDPNNPHETKNRKFLEQIKKRQEIRLKQTSPGAPVAPVLPPPPQETSLNIPDSGQDTRTIVYMINQKEEVAVPFPVQFPVPSQTVAQAPSSPSLSALWM